MGYQLLFVPKENFNKLRICVDFRHLNNIIKKDGTLILKIDEILDRLQGATLFIKFDVIEVYYRIRMGEGKE